MASTIGGFVVTDANKELCSRIMAVTQTGDQTLLFVYGPPRSGKTTLVQGRGRERDLLSDKEVVFCHISELVSFFNLGEVGEQFLERIGLAEVVLLDGFEKCFEGEEIALQLAKLLIESRTKAGLDTLVFSGKPFDELDVAALDGVLDGFERWELVPLGEEDILDLVRATYERERKSTQGAQRATVLTDDALEYLAKNHGADLDEMKSAVRFLVTVAAFDEGQEVDAALVREALGDDETA